MKYIKVPAKVMVRHPQATEGGEDVTFKQAAFACWLNDDRVGFQPVKLARWAKVIEAFDKAEDGSTITLDDQDYATLKTIVEEPKTGYPPLVGMQLLPFYDAVLKASDKVE